MAIRAVIFDLFDTLVDLHMENLQPVEVGGRRVSGTVAALHGIVKSREPIAFDAFAEVLAQVDHALWRERVREGRELPTTERFEVLCARLGLGDVDLPGLLTDCHMDALHAQVGMPGDHPEILQALRGSARLALCSNFTHAAKAREILDEYALTAHLDAIVVSEEVGIRKPRPEIFEATLDALGVGADEALHVGDNLSADIGGAHEVGIRTVWITRRVPDPGRALEVWKGPRPDFEVREMAELPPIVASLSEREA